MASKGCRFLKTGSIFRVMGHNKARLMNLACAPEKSLWETNFSSVSRCTQLHSRQRRKFPDGNQNSKITLANCFLLCFFTLRFRMFCSSQLSLSHSLCLVFFLFFFSFCKLELTNGWRGGGRKNVPQ